MNPLATYLTLLVGPTIAVPAPPPLVDALQSVEVTHTDEGPSGFRLTFEAGRSGPLDLADYRLLSLPLLRPFFRVILVVTIGAVPRVLMDGIITNQQLSPLSQPGSSTLTVMGEDVSVMMDMEEKSAEHPAQDDPIVALKLIASYAAYGLIPMVLPPPVIDPPLPTNRIPVQQGTDLEHLRTMAGRHGFVFYIAPGPAPFTSTAYWGPPRRLDIPQRALTVNMGPDSNVESLNFQNDALSPTLVEGQVQDRLTGQTMPVRTFVSTRPPLSSQPSTLVNQPNVRRRQFRESGLNAMQAFGRAQGITDNASDALTATGELDGSRYGGILQARGLVGVRGAGYSHDGLWYVQSVTHTVQRGEYKQRFTLRRDGVGSTTPAVVP